MSGSEKRRREIIQEIDKSGKKAFLVEGEDDVACYRMIFNKQFLGQRFENKLFITHAGGKGILTDILAKEQDWLGLIDRDEWSEDIIRQKEGELQNLHILPRFCLES